jgi:hypothetical protein
MRRNETALLVVTLVITILIIIIVVVRELQDQDDHGDKLFHPKFDLDVVVLATVRDCDRFLGRSMKKSKMVLNCFKRSRMIVFENDSNDGSLATLMRHSGKDSRITVVSETSVPGERTQRLAYARNLLLKRALKLNPRYIVVMDMDNVNLELTRAGFMSCFDESAPKEWAVLGSNQKGIYYDLWALRTLDDWVPGDVWEGCFTDAPQKTRDVHGARANARIRKATRHVDRSLEVRSCFGGLAVYKTEFIPRDGPEVVYYDGGGPLGSAFQKCEHVSLSERIGESGGSIWINAAMVNH